MSLRATIAKAVDSAFTAAGDIPQSVIYRRNIVTYDPSTGNSTVVENDTAVNAIFTRFNEIEVARTVGLQITDVKMIVQVKSMTIVPSIQIDTVVTPTKTYNIINYNVDPSGSIYMIQLRAP